MATRHFIAFWNVENLFDTENAARSEGLARRLAKDLKGWSRPVLDRKIANLAGAIRAMNDGAGPDILGVAEVESRAVLEQLAAAMGGDRYGIAHADSPDQRGIDTAFIYDRRRYELPDDQVFTHFVMRRTYTRDILQASFRTEGGRTLALFVNHWPSRSGGRLESEPYRMTAAETLAHWHNRVHEEQGEDIAVLAMGDFNDEPGDRSLRDHALATAYRKRVTGTRTVRRFLNLTAPIAGSGDGTYFFDSQYNMLDQILAGGAALTGRSGFEVAGPAMILRAPGLKDKPRPYGRPAVKGGVDQGGFSDHHAVAVVLRER